MKEIIKALYALFDLIQVLRRGPHARGADFKTPESDFNEAMSNLLTKLEKKEGETEDGKKSRWTSYFRS